MPDTPISDLPTAFGLGDNDFLLLSVGDTSYKITGADLKQSLADGGIVGMIFTAVGDLLVGGGADTVDVLPVGNDGEVLTADSAAVAGVTWKASPDALRPNTTPQDVGEVTISVTEGNLDLESKNAGDINLYASGGASVNIVSDKQIVLQSRGDGGIIIDNDADGEILIHGLRTSEGAPTSGALWNSGGTLRIS